jgi:phospholipid/cholesterol/gamma-HCH transport system permease protein
MKKNTPSLSAKEFASRQSVRLTDKTLAKAENAKNFFSNLGSGTIFIFKTLRHSFSFPLEFRELLRQCYEVGNKSFPLVAITGFIMGLVLTIQSRPILNEFGAESMLPQMVSISLIREIGPVITALICAGKVGSGIGAELGSMKVTEQIDAMEVSATNPMKYLVVTRVIATTLMLPILILFADTMGLLGSWAGVNIKSEMNVVLYFSRAFSVVDFIDFIPALIKSFFFGAVIGIIGCYKGYHAGRGTESVGIAANSAVVLSSLLIIIVDLIAAQITDMLP